MRKFDIGALVVLNSKTQPMHEHKGWLVSGRRAKILGVDSENKASGNRWYRVQLLGNSGNVIGVSTVPSNWLDPSP